MRPLERLYRSPLARPMSAVARRLSAIQRPRMVYGFPDSRTGQFRKHTRVSGTAVIINRSGLSMADHVWVWHHSILDATEGLEIGEGAQIGAWVGLFTHGSESSIRLMGRTFIDVPNTERIGYTRGGVIIGSYSFIGAGSAVLPGVRIGKGCLIAAMSLVTRDVPDYGIVRGQPAKIIGDTREYDAKNFPNLDYASTYYDAGALSHIQALLETGPSD